MNKLKYMLLVVIIASFTVSCDGKKTTSDLQKIIGQQIILPQDGTWIKLEKDTGV